MNVLLKGDGDVEPVAVRLERNDPAHADRLTAEVAGAVHDVSIERATPTMGRIGQGPRSKPFRVLVQGGRVTVWMDGCIHEFERIERTARRAAAGAVAGGLELTAPMPGRVLRVEVTEGSTFDAHAALIIMESMKMEMTLSAPQAGRVREILCQAGELVEMGARLAVLEPLDGDDA